MFSFRWFFTLFLTLIFLSSCNRDQPNLKPRNLVLISIDTLRADRLGCYGYPKPTSPALDKIASEGLLFENMYTPSPWTLPAHMSLLTGLYPSRHGVKSRGTKLPNGVDTLAEVLSGHGFATAAVINYLYLDQRFGFAKGFDYYKQIPENQTTKGAASTINSLAKKLLLNRPDKPFFFFLHYFDVHSDYTPKDRYKKQFTTPYQGIADGSTIQLMAFRKGLVLLSQKDIQHFSDLYDGEIRQLDDELGKLFLFFKEQGLWEQTLLIVTSDHGEEFLEHGGVLHGQTQYQESIHVPMIMHGPGIPKSKRIEGNSSLVDVMPTVLGMLGIETPDTLDGIDLQPTWGSSETKLPSRFIFAEADHHDIKRAVFHQHYKLHYDLLTKKSQLYDLTKDPNEKYDLADKDTSAANQLFSQLRQFMRVENKGQPLEELSSEEINRLKSLGYTR